MICDGTRWRTRGKWRGNWRMEWVAFTLPRNFVYPAFLPLMRTHRLPVVDWTDAPADWNWLIRFAERRNLVSARVPSHLKRNLPVKSRTCESEEEVERGGLEFELVFLIVFYVIYKVVLVINLDDSLFHVLHFTFYELYHNLKVSISSGKWLSMYRQFFSCHFLLFWSSTYRHIFCCKTFLQSTQTKDSGLTLQCFFSNFVVLKKLTDSMTA